MRRQSAAWERAAEVREAARGWLRAGAVDEPTEHAISGAGSARRRPGTSVSSFRRCPAGAPRPARRRRF